MSNPQSFPIQADLHMILRTLADRQLTILSNGTAVWSGNLNKAHRVKVRRDKLILRPGKNILEFRSEGPPILDAHGNPIAFGLWNAVLVLDRGL